jgi:hypothetical protein
MNVAVLTMEDHGLQVMQLFHRYNCWIDDWLELYKEIGDDSTANNSEEKATQLL